MEKWGETIIHAIYFYAWAPFFLSWSVKIMMEFFVVVEIKFDFYLLIRK